MLNRAKFSLFVRWKQYRNEIGKTALKGLGTVKKMCAGVRQLGPKAKDCFAEWAYICISLIWNEKSERIT